MPLLGATGGGSAKGFGALANLGYFIRNSLRLRRSASAYLSKTPADSNKKTWTISMWFKRGSLGSAQNLFSAFYAGGGRYMQFDITPSDTLDCYSGIYNLVSTSASFNLTSNQVLRDPSAWYHVILAVDTTQATSSNRVKLYLNGSQITSLGTATYPSLNDDTFVNSSSVPFYVGTMDVNYFDGYIAEVNFIDGQALTPSSFGKTDAATGQWIPKKFAGTYGTNGFYLKFADASAATAAAIGKDSSPNGNNFTPNNISVTAGVTYDAMTDSPTLSATASNYPVLSPLNYRTYSGSATPTISAGNLDVTQASTVASCIGTATMGVSSGKWYWEATFISGNGSNNSFLGVVNGQLQNTTPNDLGYYSNEYAYKSGNGYKYTNNTQTAYGATFTSGDVIGFALDLSAGTLTFYKNNVSQGVAFSSLPTGDYYFPAFDTYYNNKFGYNFGQRPFAYTPPADHKAINTFNLP